MPDRRGKARLAPTAGQFGKPIRGSLGTIVGAFKSASSKRINELRGTPGGLVWQRNYYEHVIRDEAELQRVREYIVNNPIRWLEDVNNPNRASDGTLQSEFEGIFVGARRALPSSVLPRRSGEKILP